MTVGEMASHNHSASSNNTGAHTHVVNLNQLNSAGEGGSGKLATGSENAEGTIPNINTNSGGNHSHTITISNTGSSTAHNNIPPYLTVYMFRRTA